MKTRLILIAVTLLLLAGLAGCQPEGVVRDQQTGRLVTATPPLSPLPSPSFTPSPIPTSPPAPTLPPAIPRVVAEPVIQTRDGNVFNLVYMPKADWFSQPGAQGELCDLRVSPDGKWAALNMCHTEGYSAVFVVNLREDRAMRVGVPDERLGFKQTLFRGWFPDSSRVLLMSDFGILGITDIESGKFVRISPRGEMVTDAAVSPDGQTIIYTNIQGDALKFIGINGELLASVPSPSPKPGNRPENLSWSPDGSWVAFTWDQGIVGYAGPLWIVDVDSKSSRQLSPPGVYDMAVEWAPNSTGILVSRRENVQSVAADFDPAKWVSDLWIVTLDSDVWSQVTRLQGKSAWAPIWVPDGSAVVFMSNLSDQPNAWMINSDGTGLQQLTFDSQMMPSTVGIVP